MRREPRSICRGSRVSFRKPPRPAAFSTHHRKRRGFNLNAKQHRMRYLYLSFTVCLPLLSSTSGQVCRGPSPRRHCRTDHADPSIASDWLLDPLDLHLMRMDHPVALVPPLRFLALFFLLLSFLCDLTVAPEEICAVPPLTCYYVETDCRATYRNRPVFAWHW